MATLADSLDMDINGMRKNGIRKVYFWGGLTHLVPKWRNCCSLGPVVLWPFLKGISTTSSTDTEGFDNF